MLKHALAEADMEMNQKYSYKIFWNNLRIPALILAAATLLSTNRAYASEAVGIVKVKFTVSAGIRDENGLPGVEGETSNTKYSINEVTTLEEYMMQWDDEDSDEDDNDRKDNSDLLAWNTTYLAIQDYSEVVYAVLIDAEEDYYFSSDIEKVKVSGLGAECVRLERLNSKKTLVLFVRFADMDYLAGEVEQAGWQDNGRAFWSYTGNAAWYELRLYMDGKLRGDTKKTGASTYDFRPLMQKAGNYSYQIRPVSTNGKAKEWVGAEACTVTAEQAAQYRELFALEAVTEVIGEGIGPPIITGYKNTGWQKAENGQYWYRETDGAYPQQNWLLDGENWYFFNSDGYMMTEEYVKWVSETYYVDAEGKMLTGGKAPDGRVAGEDGKLRWADV